MNLTSSRKKQFARQLLGTIPSKIGFVDVGAGGVLKYPWDLLPADRLEKFAYEPTHQQEPVSLCISNRLGQSKFYIAVDERCSSLHEPSRQYIDKFHDHTVEIKEVIDVRLSTLDNLLLNHYSEIDLIDINAEGHDYQVLEGMEQLLDKGKIKLLKIEFELTEVWKDQGWFGNIEGFLRKRGFDLARIEIDYARPAKVKRIFHQGEPVWGKAYYVPSSSLWKQIVQKNGLKIFRDDVLKAVVLYTMTDLPGRAVDLLDDEQLSAHLNADAKELKEKIFWVFRFSRLDWCSAQSMKMARFLTKKISGK